MNKPNSEWPVSLVMAIVVTIGCGFVLNTYYGAMMDDLGAISMPMIAVAMAVLASVGMWVEAIRTFKVFKHKALISYKRTQEREQSKMHWPAAKTDANAQEPETQIKRVFKVDE
jgi:hypothetical protein